MTKKNQQAFATLEEKNALLASLKTTMNDLGRLPGLIFAPIIAYVAAHYAKIPAERKGHLEKILEEIKAGGGEGVEKLKGWFHDMLHKNDNKKPSSKGGKNSKLPTPKKPLKKATKNSSFTEKVNNMGKSLSEKTKNASKKVTETAKSVATTTKKQSSASSKTPKKTNISTKTKPTKNTPNTTTRPGTKKPTKTESKPNNARTTNTRTKKQSVASTPKKTTSSRTRK